MSRTGFVHLHTHSEYSLLDGACRIPSLVSQAVELDMPALAITDHGVMYGVVEFYEACQEKGIKPIIGCEVYLALRSRTLRNPKLDSAQYHLVLLAENETGYRNLLKLVGAGFLEGFYYKPRVDKELLAELHDGLIALSGCLGGEIPELVRAAQFERAKYIAAQYREIFGPDNFYLELQDHGLPDQKPVNGFLVELSRELGLPLVATNDIHYMKREDADAHQVLLCIQTQSTVDDPKISFGASEFYFKSQQEMADIFREQPQALVSTMEIASRCHVRLDFDAIYLPHYEPPGRMDADTYLRQLCEEGLRTRYGQPTPEVMERLDYELRVIQEKKFAGYFLIVSDFVNYAKSQGILVGPGRGSGAGSLVAYLTGITDIDPLKYGLMFERFLTPGRITMPDFDLDFEDTRREEVVQYVRAKYGDDRVAQIVTFGTMGARVAVRDCGRALNMPLAKVDRIARMVPFSSSNLDDALRESPELQDAYVQDEDVRRLIDTARAVGGLARHCSIHAAGILISRDPLSDHVPLQKSTESDMRVAGFDMNSVAKIGLLKFDFLGLRTLSVIDRCIKMVERNRGIHIEISSIPLDDEDTYSMLRSGNTTGIFQLESPGMRKLLREIEPTCFDDLVPVVALYRPGPLGSGMVEDFVRRKRGLEEVVHIHPRCAPIMEDTYGVLLYQEQVMRIAMELASFSVEDADVLRSAMGKKKQDKINQLRPVFIQGAMRNGIPEDQAAKIYDLMANFGSYGFNKSHTASYAVVAYQTAYLKAHYPAEFMAALLTSIMGDKTKVAAYVEECRRMRLEVLGPDINQSEADFSVEGNAVRFGLAAIKNVGRALIDAVLAERARHGEFKSLHEFCIRICDATVSKTAVECLIKVGTFDALNSNRAQLLYILEDAISQATRTHRDKRNGQVSLFDGLVGEAGVQYTEPKSLPQVANMPRDEQLAMEKELLGVYISDHPLLQFREKMDKLVDTYSDQLKEKAEREEVVVGGVVLRVRKLTTKKNEPMAFVTIEDFTGPIEVTVFPSAYRDCINWLVTDGVVVVRGRVNRRDRPSGNGEHTADVGVICESVIPLKVQNASGNGVGQKAVNIRVGGLTQSQFDTLRTLLAEHPGDCPVYLHVPANGALKKVIIPLKVNPSRRFLSDIEELVGRELIWVE